MFLGDCACGEVVDVADIVCRLGEIRTLDTVQNLDRAGWNGHQHCGSHDYNACDTQITFLRDI